MSRYEAFVESVEPAISVAPRVHRFATEPVVGGADLPAAPVAVCVTPGDADAVARTRASLERQTVAPAAVTVADPAAGLASLRCERAALVGAGDTLAPRALERLGQAAALAGDAAVITTDEDVLHHERRESPRLLPGPSPDLALAADTASALLCVDRVGALDAVRDGLRAAWRQDLLLRLGGAAAEAHAHVPQILCHRSTRARRPRPGALADASRSALARSGDGATIEVSEDGGLRVRRPIAGEPSVEAVIPFRDGAALLERAVASLLEVTAWENLRVALVDNGSVGPETAALLDRLGADPRVRTLREDRPFNYAALNNAALADSDADVVLLLNNDTEVLDPTWLETLLEEALRPEVGAVAPLLLYPDDTVQHAGAALGLYGYAGHPFAGLLPDERTPFGRADTATRNWLAVTAACLVVERAKWDAVGGFDESFVVAGNDVDLCLRLTRAGYRSLCVPHARLLHDESRSRGSYIDPGDFERSEQSYGAFRTVGDPFYNPNLTLAATDCGPRRPEEMP